MEIQIPLVLFISFCAMSAGIFAMQAVLALLGEGKEIQLPSLVASVATLAVGGIAVLFHLAQPFNIFNGFGNPTSGITQELIVIVVLVIVMLVYFIMLRRNDGQIPAWCAVMAIVVALALDVVCAHSYMMSARPAWNSLLQVLSVIGASLAMGPAAVAAIAGIKKIELSGKVSAIVLVGSVVGLVTTVIYLAGMASVGESLASMGTYIDPTNPTAPVFDAASVSPFADGALPATCIAIVAAIVSAVAGFVGKTKGGWALWGAIAAVAALIAAVSLRVVFCILGVSVYNFYGITG